jgi:WD40 repeat protein
VIKTLETDNEYYVSHQRVLIKAYVWLLQNKNDGMLLNETILQHVQIWQQYAKSRLHTGLCELQHDFINESWKQIARSNAVFISFADADYDFARYLNETLLMYAKTTWFAHEFVNRNEYNDTIYQAIVRSESVVCVISEESNSDLNFRLQIGLALKLKKRIVLVYYKGIPEETISELTTVNFVQFPIEYSKFQLGFTELMRKLDYNHEILHEQTIWLEKALEWEKSGKREANLLNSLHTDELLHWLELSAKAGLELNNLLSEFIQACKKNAVERKTRKRRLDLIQRATMVATSLMLVFMLFFAYKLYVARQTEKENLLTMQRLYTQSSANNLLALARQIESNDPTIAIRLAEKAMILDPNETVKNTIYDIYKKNVFYKTLATYRIPAKQLSYSSQNKSVAFPSENNMATIINIQNKSAFNLVGHLSAVNSVETDSQGTMYVTASDDKSVRIWDRLGSLRTVLNAHDYPVKFACFSPNAKQVLSVDQNDVLILWSVKGDMLKIMPKNLKNIKKAYFAPNGSLIYLLSDQPNIWVWNTLTDSFGPVAAHPDIVLDLCLKPDNTGFFTVCADRKTREFNRNNQIIRSFDVDDALPTCIDYLPSYNLVLTASEDRTMKIWSTDGTLISELLGHEQAIIDACFVPEADQVISTSLDGKINIWDISSVLPINIYEGTTPVYTLLSSHKPNSEFAWINKTGIGMLDVKKGLITEPLPQKFKQGMFLESSPDLSIDDAFVQLTKLDAMPLEGIAAVSPTQIMKALTSGDVQIYDASGSKQIVHAHNRPITALCIFDKNAFVIGDDTGLLKIWKNNKLVATVPAHKGKVSSLAYSSQTRTIASGSTDGTIKLLTTQGKLTKILEGHENQISKLCFSADGTKLASLDKDNILRVWNDGYELRIYKLPSTPIAICFGADNKKIAWASQNGLIQTFNIPSVLQKFLVKNWHEPLSVAQMLELKIKFYEELNEENELNEGGLYYFAKADQQIDQAMQIRYLGYANNLFDRLEKINDLPIYKAQHLQVLLSLRNFERDPEDIDDQMENLLINILQIDNEHQLENAAKYFYNQAEISVNETVQQQNSKAATMLYQKLYIQFGKIEYVVPQTYLGMLFPEKNLSADYLAEFLIKPYSDLTNEKEIARAANLLFIKSLNPPTLIFQKTCLFLSDKLYTKVLKKASLGSYYVDLAEVLLHLRELDPNDQQMKNRVKNLEIQLFGIKNVEVMKSAASRFMYRAERENQQSRQIVYYTNAENLYAKLFKLLLKSEYLVNQRKALIGLQRTNNDLAELDSKIQKNLNDFEKLDNPKEIYNAIHYFDSELTLETNIPEKLKLLYLCLNLYENILKKNNNPYEQTQMFRLMLLTLKYNHNDKKVEAHLERIGQYFTQSTDINFLQSAILQFDGWIKESIDPKVIEILILKQLNIYKQLINTKASTQFLKDAWAVVNSSKLTISDQNQYKQWLFDKAKNLSDTADIRKWSEFLVTDVAPELNNEADEMYVRLEAKKLMESKPRSPRINQLLFEQYCILSRSELYAKRYDQAHTYAQQAISLDKANPQGYSLAALSLLGKGEKREASHIYKEHIKKSYAGKTFAAYFLADLRDAIRRGFSMEYTDVLQKLLK